jgi:thioredoxin 1
MAHIEVDEMNFEQVISEEFSKGQIVILKFGSEFCDACIAQDFELEELEDKHENISVLEIDCADAEDLTQRYAITQVPTIVIYENENSVIWQKDGVILAQDIETIIGF